MKRCIIGLSAVVIVFLGAGCTGTVSVKQTEQRKTVCQLAEHSMEAGSVSELTQRSLQLLDLWELAKTDRVAAIYQLNLRWQERELRSACFAAAELSWKECLARRDDSVGGGLDYALLTAYFSYQYLFSNQEKLRDGAFDPRFGVTTGLYNLAVGEVVKRLQGDLDRFPTIAVLHKADVFGQTLILTQEKSDQSISVSDYQKYVPTGQLSVKGLRQRHRRPGLGAALIASRPNRGGKDKHRPPEGIYEPVTAVLHFDLTKREPGSARLEFIDSRTHGRVNVGPHSVPLSADFTSPYAALLAHAKLREIGAIGAFNPTKADFHRGVFMLEPYNPDKIPVLMIHGLFSSPLTWRELTNDLTGAAEFRERYQIWHYMYPTGYPYLYNAQKLREELRDMQATLDPKGESVAFRSIVVVAHSMGGLVTRGLVSHSGTKVWDALFTVPIDDNQLKSVAVLPELKDFTMFEPNPGIKRIVFMAVPHRGSDRADHFLAKIVSSFTKVSKKFLHRNRQIFQATRKFLTEPARLRLFNDINDITGINSLSTDCPITRSISTLPISSKVPYHSIIASKTVDTSDLDDGWVRYQSAHLDGAESELIVRSGHRVTTNPVAIAEVKRIMRLHMKDLPSEATRK